MEQDRPYFMSNPKWFYFDEQAHNYVLTDDAPQKARESYEEFYNDSLEMLGFDELLKN